MIRTRPRWGVERWPLRLLDSERGPLGQRCNASHEASEVSPGGPHRTVVWVERSDPSVWPLFSRHHYLTTLNPAANCYIGVDAEGALVGFVSAIPQPSRFGGYWREHRLVVLPRARGRGIGVALSEWLGEQALASGHRYYSRTRNVAVIEARDRSARWRRTRRRSRKGDGNRRMTQIEVQDAVTTGHEYVGVPGMAWRPCERCGLLFPARRSHAKTCSVACRVAAHRADRYPAMTAL